MSNRTSAEVFPPGEFIRDELDARGWTQADLAKIMSRPMTTINQIITGKKAVTPQTAQELGAAFGTSAHQWMNLESSYRLSLAHIPEEPIKHRARLFELAPVKDMEARGWIKQTDSADELERELLRFFHVQSVDQIEDYQMAARASAVALAEQRAWSRRALNLAPQVQCKRFTKHGFEDGCKLLRELAAYPEEVGKVPRVLADMGIRLIVVEHLPRTKIDGAALWWRAGSPLLVLSMRYARIDYFWHTLCHELSHIRHQDQYAPDVDLMQKVGKERTEIESRADEESASMLVPPKRLESFIVRVKPYFSKQRIIQFATTMGVHPGIVAGQLQYRREIKYSANREMLVDVRDILVSEALTDGWGKSPILN